MRLANIFKFLKESRNYFYIITGLFFISSLIGFVFPVFFSEEIRGFIEKIVQETSQMNFFELFIFIFKNNLLASFFGLIFGIVLGIAPVAYAVVNGYVLGFVARKSVDAAGFGVLVRLLPHGIFELPALFISLGMGLRIGLVIFRKEKFSRVLKSSLLAFVLAVIPLLIIAAFIEAGLIILMG